MSLENYTRRVRQETLEELVLLDKTIERKYATIQRLKETKPGFNPRVVIERNQTELEEMKSKRHVLELKIQKIENGLFETELQAELDRNRELIAQKTTQTERKKQVEQQSKFLLKPKPKKTFHSVAPPSDYTFKREFDYAEKQFHRDSASLPDHLADKLQNMPNNLGYVWKDIWFFGAKEPEQTREYSLFEKRGGRMLVHVYNLQSQTYQFMEKDNSGRRKLISSTKMQNLSRSNSLGDLLDRGFANTSK